MLRWKFLACIWVVLFVASMIFWRNYSSQADVKMDWRYLGIEEVDAEGKGFAPQFLAYNGDTFVAADPGYGSKRPGMRIWYSQDGLSWKKSSVWGRVAEGGSDLRVTNLVRWRGGFLAGALVKNRKGETLGEAAWSSSDGVDWERIGIPPWMSLGDYYRARSSGDHVYALDLSGTAVWRLAPDLGWAKVREGMRGRPLTGPFPAVDLSAVAEGAAPLVWETVTGKMESEHGGIKVFDSMDTERTHELEEEIVGISAVAADEDKVFIAAMRDIGSEEGDGGGYDLSADQVFLAGKRSDDVAQWKKIEPPVSDPMTESLPLVNGAEFLRDGTFLLRGSVFAREMESPAVWIAAGLGRELVFYRLPYFMDGGRLGAVAGDSGRVIILAEDGNGNVSTPGIFLGTRKG